MSKSIIVVSGIILFAVVGLGLFLLFPLERVALERELAGEMVSIPGGSFFMGNMSDCVEEEKQGDDLVTWFFVSPAPYDYDRTAPVSSFPANAWGLHDMHGNVWERVQDCWNDSYEGAPTDGSAWMNSDCGGLRVIRGGAWYNDPRSLRSTDRSWSDRSNRGYAIGFRLAQDE